MKTKRAWLVVALINFLFAAGMGALLRLAFVVELSWIKYQYLLHAHSHIAMLGWIYMALFALLVHAFVPEGKSLKRYGQLFWLTQISVIGMLLSFPVQGYGPVSIAFSTVHILFSYMFILWLWRDMGAQRTFSRLLLRTALLFQLFSTLGVWLMGPIMAGPLRQSSFYYLAVQFYLHFQFNGWFIIGALALFFKLLEDRNIAVPRFRQRRFYQFLLVSVFLSYGLVVVWGTQIKAFLVVNGIGVITQLLALALFWQLIRLDDNGYPKKLFPGLAGKALTLAFFSFSLKIFLQALTVIPPVAQAAFTIRNYIIGFIHLMLLGAVTLFVLSYAIREGLLSVQSAVARWGIWMIGLGFVLSESLLLLQGTLQWSRLGFLPVYYESLFGVSALIPIGLLLCVFKGISYRSSKKSNSF
ncbi:MAG: hypothetical protein R2806_25620 [Saprospiraceae bacterium]|nr:hypothetical protein [Lewinella sp.]